MLTWIGGVEWESACLMHLWVEATVGLYIYFVSSSAIAPITRTNYSQLGQHFLILLNIEKPSREVNMI